MADVKVDTKTTFTLTLSEVEAQVIYELIGCVVSGEVAGPLYRATRALDDALKAEGLSYLDPDPVQLEIDQLEGEVPFILLNERSV